MKRSDDASFDELDLPSERSLPPGQLAALKADVLRRIREGEGGHGDSPAERRPRRVSRRLLPVLGALIIGASAGSLTTAYALADAGRPAADADSLATISTAGSPARLTPRSKEMINFSARRPVDPGLPKSKGQALLMARRGPTAFFHVRLEGGDACFYTGSAASEDGVFELGAGSCWAPTTRFPILDLSPIQAAGPGGFQVLQIQGFAADGVKTVAVTDLSGIVVAETAVRNNVYKITAYPPAGVSALLALDEGGNILQRVTYTR